MRVIVEMAIITTDYGGKEFMSEIEKLLKDIDPSGETKLVAFKMREKSTDSTRDERAIDWMDDTESL
jgi:hypothetical protein